MLIQCTKKLLDQLNIKEIKEIDEEPLFSWHANLVIVNRRKAVILVNDSNRYVIVLYGLKAKNFKNLDQHIIDAICETLRDDGINNEAITNYISQSKQIVYTKTKNKSMVARMIKGCEYINFYEYLLNNESITQSVVGIKSSHFLVGEGKNDYIHPNEIMYKDLSNYTSKPIISAKMIQLKITLNLENHEVWRRIIVPQYTTFEQMHEIIQKTFGWGDYHLHEYYLMNDNKPILNIVSDLEAFDYGSNLEMILERGMRLIDYSSKCTHIKYIYDFGDNWEHIIEIEKMMDDNPINYPACVDGKGNTPPEDVGGEGGYKEFLEGLSDPNHPEHEHYVSWGKMQKYRDFNIDDINRGLKYTLYF